MCIRDSFGKYKPSGVCLIIMDGAKCHLDYSIVQAAEARDFMLFCLPSNTTHELQPMDKSVFSAFESYWNDELMNYWTRTEDRDLPKHRFGNIFIPVWEKAATPRNVSAGFEACGIYPWNPNRIPLHRARLLKFHRLSYRKLCYKHQTQYQSQDQVHLGHFHL